MTSAADVSPCGTYRYTLTRVWDGTLSPVVFCMLNPSTADANTDDPTIRRCVTFARSWGYGGLTVVNLFALRSADPKALLTAVDPVGPDNDAHIGWECNNMDRVICAWGASVDHPTLHDRAVYVRCLLTARARRVECLGVTKAGYPRHPLYVKGNTVPQLF